jgi:uncharacterized protein
MPLLLCPNCQTGMQEVNRNSVQIDICPDCRGVWLDRGELEKLLGSIKETEKEWQEHREEPSPQSMRSREEDMRQRQYQERYEKPEHQEHYSRVGGYRKKSAFERLSDLFD